MKETKQATKVSVSISERIAVLVMMLAGVAFGGVLLAGMLFTSLEPKSATPTEQPVKRIGMADPSAVYCKMLGYTFEIKDTELGQRGICVLPGEKCDAWAFLAGTCGQKYSYCVKNGYEIETRSDGQDPFSKYYAVCVDSSKSVIGSITELTDLFEKSVVGNNLDAFIEDLELKDISATLPDDWPDSKSLPSSFDWRNHNGRNWMTKVTDQGCGDCWAHSIIGTTEAAFNIAMGNEGIPPNYNLDLSEQQLVSNCCGLCGNCQGTDDPTQGSDHIRDFFPCDYSYTIYQL